MLTVRAAVGELSADAHEAHSFARCSRILGGSRGVIYMQGEPYGTNSLHSDSVQGSVGAMETKKTARRCIASRTRSMRSISSSAIWTGTRRSSLLRDGRIAAFAVRTPSPGLCEALLGGCLRHGRGAFFLEKSCPWKFNFNNKCYPEREPFFEAN